MQASSDPSPAEVETPGADDHIEQSGLEGPRPREDEDRASPAPPVETAEDHISDGPHEPSEVEKRMGKEARQRALQQVRAAAQETLWLLKAAQGGDSRD